MHKHMVNESILNIDMICRHMYLTFEEVTTYKISPASVVYSNILRQNYLQLCSIMDEFTILHNLAKDDTYLKDTLFCVSPALKAINKFTGIRKARIFFIAHYNRDKKGKFHPWWITLKELNLPRSESEIKNIQICLHCINSILVSRYYSELEQISAQCKMQHDEYFEWVEKQENKILDNNISKQIFDDVMSRLAEKKIDDTLILDFVMTDIIEKSGDKIRY